MTAARRAGAAVLALAAALLLAAPALPAGPPRYSVTLTRTAEGVVHILAADMGSLGYGAGYSAGEDNGCIIADTVVTVRGERSKQFGAKARVAVGFNEIANLDSDFFHRAVGDLPALRAAFAATSRDNRQLVAGFVAGYNRLLRDAPQRLAPECRGAPWVRPIALDDMLLLLNDAAIQGSAAPYARFIARAAPPEPGAPPEPAEPGDAPLPDPVQQGLGSNGWAFGGDVTVDGRGILVGNPHFPWTGHNRFRRLHLTIPGKLDVMGAGLVGSPYVSIGFNRDLGWTHTVATSQHLTLESLRLDPADPTRYLFDGQSLAMTRRSETVEVRDAPPVTRTLYATRFGPMIAIPGSGLPWSAAVAYALRDADQANLRAGDAWLGFARARTVEALRDAAARTLGIPNVNTLAADRRGHALFGDISAVPDLDLDTLAACSVGEASKPDAESPSIFLLDASSSACDWTVDPASPIAGLMPAKDLPIAIRRDWLANSNDSYWLANPDAPFAQLSPVLGPWATRQGLRTRSAIRAIRAALAEAPAHRLGSAQIRALVLENRVEAAVLALDDLLALCPRRPALAPACTVLAGWDRHADVQSRGALLFFGFWRKVQPVRDLWAVPFDPAHPVSTPSGLNPAAAPAILDALQSAADELAQAGTPLDAPLGSVQVAPRGADRIAIHGGPSIAGVLNAMHSSRTPAGLVPYHGTSYAQLVSFDARGPVVESLLAYSQSTNPESPWFADGTRAYSAKRWLRLPFAPAEIAAQQVGAPLRLTE